MFTLELGEIFETCALTSPTCALTSPISALGEIFDTEALADGEMSETDTDADADDELGAFIMAVEEALEDALALLSA